MLFGKFRILGKLALLVLVPLVGVVALSVPIVANRINAARTAQDTADLVSLAARVGTALQDLQQERLLSVGYLYDLARKPDLVVQTTQSRESIARLADGDRPLPARLKQALDSAADLDDIRAQVLTKQVRPDLLVTGYTAVVERITDALELAPQADLTTAVGRQVFALDQALRTDDLIGQATTYVTSAVATRQPAIISLFGGSLSEVQFIVHQARPLFTPEQYNLYLLAQQAFVSRVGEGFFERVAVDPGGAIRTLNPRTLYPTLQSTLVLGGFLQKRIVADVDAAAAKNRRDATNQAYLIGAISALLLLMVFGLSILMARAVARPLRRLTASADRIARTAETELQRVADDDAESARPIRLDAVDVQAEDEIGDLARAFDRVQSTAARLVERQVAGRRNVAQMFGHVGRRTQNLVGRQLALIDSLERRETDTDRLRELYRLDHLSSRLRRNASSLVVLSGGAGANDHLAPMALGDVVRLALGEIEDYPRVDVEVPDEFAVLPAVVADLTLLLAELMENATSFSPPHTRVTVTADGRPDGVRLAVIDHGLGLPAERLAEENARLTTRERLDLAPSEVLGLFVVGRLARRHALAVSLAATPGGGLTAYVDLQPSHLLSRPLASVRVGAAPAGAAAAQPIAAVVPVPDQAPAAPASDGAAPFDSHALTRATRTLEAGRTWNAFAPARAGSAALQAAPPEVAAPAQPATPAQPSRPAQPTMQLPVTASRNGPYADNPAPIVVADSIGQSDPVAPGGPPNQRTSAGHSTLRRRIPGNQLPTGTAPKLPVAPPTAADATAARDLVEAFEAGVSRAQWEVIETDLATPPTADHPPLARRVPGATLPLSAPPKPVPQAAPAKPMDPDEARNLIEQFEYGVAMALNERPQPEGQPT